MAHRLACRNKTLDQLRISVESHLDDYFEKNTKKEWAAVVKKVSIALPHGIYRLRPEMFPTLQPDIYPYDDEADRIFVAEEVERYRMSLASEAQGSNQKARRKRPIIPESEDEEEAERTEKKAKVKANTRTIQETVHDDLTSQPHLAPPSSPHSASNTTQAKETAHDSVPISQALTRYQNSSEPDIGTYVEDLLKSTFIQEIKALKEVNHRFQKELLEIEKLKTAAVKLQQKLSTKKAAGRSLFQRTWYKRSETHKFIQGMCTNLFIIGKLSNVTRRKG